MRTTNRIWVVVSLFVGVAAGLLLMKYHHNSSDTIVAVNGTEINRDQLFDAMQEEYGVLVMHKLVTNELEMQFAAKKGLVPTDSQVAAQFAMLKSQPNFDLILRNSGLSESAFKENLKLQMAQDAIFCQGVTVTDNEVKNYYNQECNPANPKALFFRQPASTLQAIATDTEADAENVISQINEGTPFDMVAQKVSLDPSRISGGRLNPIVLGQSPLSKSPQIEQDVFSLRVGQISEPLYFNKEWWVFKCDDYTPASRIPFADVAAQARQEALTSKGFVQNGPALKQEFLAFSKSANLQAFWPQYAAAFGVR